ncbi:response regulator [uncultured Desulfuromusa sp.]|uniref:response regulator n=1 Tax=uncultured Desulfuromusa sp. TaxID=219183 RepID=UPI002AA6DA63|nr:response regulator [uncultured Desulfuromusa sp.]
MKSLVVEDEFTSRLVLQKLLGEYGEVHIASNGQEAVEAVHLSHKEGAPYNLIALDIMMPGMNGTEALRKIREIEEVLSIAPGEGVKIIMTTSLGDGKSIMASFKDQCDGYLVKPIEKVKLLKYLQEFQLM